MSQEIFELSSSENESDDEMEMEQTNEYQDRIGGTTWPEFVTRTGKKVQLDVSRVGQTKEGLELAKAVGGSMPFPIRDLKFNPLLKVYGVKSEELIAVLTSFPFAIVSPMFTPTLYMFIDGDGSPETIYPRWITTDDVNYRYNTVSKLLSEIHRSGDQFYVEKYIKHYQKQLLAIKDKVKHEFAGNDIYVALSKKFREEGFPLKLEFLTPDDISAIHSFYNQLRTATLDLMICKEMQIYFFSNKAFQKLDTLFSHFRSKLFRSAVKIEVDDKLEEEDRQNMINEIREKNNILLSRKKAYFEEVKQMPEYAHVELNTPDELFITLGPGDQFEQRTWDFVNYRHIISLMYIYCLE